MKKLYSYRQFVAGLLLLVFLLSVTPKRFLHDSLAKHIDDCKLTNTISVASKYNAITSVGYNCRIDDLVVEGFFMQSTEIIVDDIKLFSSDYIGKGYGSQLISEHHIFRLRGPPIEMSFI